MSTFPTLRTGAIAQYPVQREIRFSTQTVQFVDGTEQRFRGLATFMRRWVIRLELMDEAELHSLREFFRTEGGAASEFTFIDPFDKKPYAGCTFEGDLMAEQLADLGRGSTTATIVQNLG